MDVGKIRFAVIGFGHIGRRHVETIKENPDCELVAICDINPQKPEIAGGSTVFYSSIDELLKDNNIKIDVLSIATPNGLHEEHAIKGLRAGWHVLVEKPLALTKKACERIIAEAEVQQKHVFCVMQNRYSPVSVWLKQIMERKILGNIYMVQVNCFWNRDDRYYTTDSWHGTNKLDGGTLFTQFSHFVDTLLWLFGDITNINARFANFNHSGLTEFEDSGTVQFDFEEGGMGSFNYSTACWNKNLESSITIIAENGSIKISGQYMDVVAYCNIKGDGFQKKDDYGIPEVSVANHKYVFENVVDTLRGRQPIATAPIEGQRVVELIEKIYNTK